MFEEAVKLFAKGVIEQIFIFCLLLLSHSQFDSLGFGSDVEPKLFAFVFYSLQGVHIMYLLFLLSEFMIMAELLQTVRQSQYLSFLRSPLD